MLRAFGEFLLVFWILGLIVHLDGLIHLFGVAALALIAIDLLVASPGSRRYASSSRRSLF